MIRSLARVGLYVAIAILATPAQANLIVNGSFEEPDVGPMDVATFFPGPVPPGFGWTVSSGNVEVAGELYPLLPGPAFDGSQYLDLNGTSIGSIAQFFDTTPGADYRLSFAYASNYAHHGVLDPAFAMVFITDVSTLTQLVTPFAISHGTSSSTDLDWVAVEVDFTAIGSSTGLGFNSESRNTPLGGILLDSIVVAPEPGTASLCFVGLVALAIPRRASEPRARPRQVSSFGSAPRDS